MTLHPMTYIRYLADLAFYTRHLRRCGVPNRSRESKKDRSAFVTRLLLGSTMNNFAVSTDKILETGLASSSSSLTSQSPFPNVVPAENRRFKIAAAIAFVLLALIAAAALVGIYLSQPQPPPEVFTIKLKDGDSLTSVRLQVKYDKSLKVEYTMTPTVGNPGEIIYMLKDFSRALVVHKDFQQGLCLVGHLNDTEDSAKLRVKAFKNKQMQIAATENFLVLNGTIHPEVLEFAAGRRIARYCGSLPAHWVVKFEPTTQIPTSNPVENHEEIQVATVHPNAPEETTGEEEKMQILTDSLTASERARIELPPEDPVLIQKAEDIALLEEKTSILAEKLDIPEDTIRPNDQVVEEKLALLEEELRPHQQHIPAIFGDDDSKRLKGEDGGEEGLDVGTGNLFSETLNSDEKLGDERPDDIKSSADEKSTVQKAPHSHEDPFAHSLKDGDVTTFPPNMATSTLISLHNDKISSAFGEKHFKRRKRWTCDVHCWYFIRKLKGYRRCFHKCF